MAEIEKAAQNIQPVQGNPGKVESGPFIGVPPAVEAQPGTPVEYPPTQVIPPGGSVEHRPVMPPVVLPPDALRTRRGYARVYTADIPSGEVHAEASGNRPGERFREAMADFDPSVEMTEAQATRLGKIRDHVSGALGDVLEGGAAERREATVQDLVSTAQAAIEQGTRPSEEAGLVPELTDRVALNAFARLTPRQAEIAMLLYGLDMSPQDIAARLGTTPTNIYIHNGKIKEKLAAATGREATQRVRNPEVVEQMPVIRQAIARLGTTRSREIANHLGLDLSLVTEAIQFIRADDRAAERAAAARAERRREQHAAEVEGVSTPLLTPTGNEGEFQVRDGGTVHVTPALQPMLTHLHETGTSEVVSARWLRDVLGLASEDATRQYVYRLRQALAPQGVRMVYDLESGGYSLHHHTTSPSLSARPVLTSALQEERPAGMSIGDERRKLRNITRMIPQADADDRVPGFVSRADLIKWLNIPGRPEQKEEHLQHYLLRHEQVLREQGRRLGSLTKMVNEKPIEYFWVEAVSTDAPYVTVTEGVRSGDRELELDSVERYMLGRLTRPRDKAAFDRAVAALPDNQGADVAGRIAGLNTKLREVTGVEGDVIVVDGNEQSGYFYRAHGVEIEDRSSLNAVEPGNIDGLNLLLSGADIEVVRAAVTGGTRTGQEQEINNAQLFENFRTSLISLIKREREGILQEREAELYARITTELETQGIEVYAFLRSMAVVLNVAQRRVKEEDTRERLH